MSSLWTPQFIYALGIALALGNVLAIGIHIFTWFLRKKPVARLVIACLGGLAFLLFLGGGACVITLISRMPSFNIDGPPPVPPQNWQFKALAQVLIFFGTTCLVVGFVGACQMRQIPASWYIATLCFCFELSLIFLPLSVISDGRIMSSLQAAFGYARWQILNKTFVYTFVLSLLFVALFRPLFLVVLKYICRQVNPTRFHTEQFS